MCDLRYRVLRGVTLEIFDGTPGSGSGSGGHHGKCTHVTRGKRSGEGAQPRAYGHVTPGLGWEMGVNLETVAM